MKTVAPFSTCCLGLAALVAGRVVAVSACSSLLGCGEPATSSESASALRALSSSHVPGRVAHRRPRTWWSGGTSPTPGQPHALLSASAGRLWQTENFLHDILPVFAKTACIRRFGRGADAPPYGLVGRVRKKVATGSLATAGVAAGSETAATRQPRRRRQARQAARRRTREAKSRRERSRAGKARALVAPEKGTAAKSSWGRGGFRSRMVVRRYSWGLENTHKIPT